jgi:hypothetical protein
VRHLATPEAQGHFHLVAIVQETTQIAHLDLIIALVSGRPELDFLDLDDLLLCPCLVLTFLFLVLELSVIHQTGDRRAGLGGNLDEINVRFLGHLHGLAQRHDADRLVIDTNQSQFRDSDFAVDAVRAFSSDAAFSIS